MRCARRPEAWKVSAVSLHYDAKFNSCLYLIILTSSTTTGAACSRCPEQTKNRQRDDPAFVSTDDQHAMRVQRKRRTGDHGTQLTRCSRRREAAALSRPSRVRSGRLVGMKGPARINRADVRMTGYGQQAFSRQPGRRMDHRPTDLYRLRRYGF